jgi:GxxExxY protein
MGGGICECKRVGARKNLSLITQISAEDLFYKINRMKENDISYDIRGAAFKIHKELGPGLLESVYETALTFELKEMGYDVKTQAAVPMNYRSIKFEVGFRLDILVNDLVIVEIKSVEKLANVHYKQLLTYLKLADKKLGLLINFNSANLQSSIKRVVNNL